MGLSEYKNGITACAGIAYIKKSYPMHYGLHLAELLCADSKKKVKAMDEEGNLLDPHYANIPKSALSFYKVQESFTEDLKTLKERTLQTDFGLDYYFGPYLLERVGDLTEKLERIKAEAAKNDKTKAAGKLRTIVSETYKDKSTAVFMLERLKEVNGGFYKDLDLDTEMKAFENNTKSQLLDLITLNSFYYGNNEN